MKLIKCCVFFCALFLSAILAIPLIAIYGYVNLAKADKFTSEMGEDFRNYMANIKG